jgi:hypothetical protein
MAEGTLGEWQGLGLNAGFSPFRILIPTPLFYGRNETIPR